MLMEESQHHPSLNEMKISLIHLKISLIHLKISSNITYP